MRAVPGHLGEVRESSRSAGCRRRARCGRRTSRRAAGRRCRRRCGRPRRAAHAAAPTAEQQGRPARRSAAPWRPARRRRRRPAAGAARGSGARRRRRRRSTTRRPAGSASPPGPGGPIAAATASAVTRHRSAVRSGRPTQPDTLRAAVSMSDCSGASKRAWYVAWSPTMLTTGVAARRALCRLASPLPRPGPRCRSVAAGRAGHPGVAVGGAGRDALEQPEHAAHLGHRVERGDEVHLARARVREARRDPGVDERADHGLGAVHGRPRSRVRPPATTRSWLTVRICFVCLGNICRSPAAAAVFARSGGGRRPRRHRRLRRHRAATTSVRARTPTRWPRRDGGASSSTTAPGSSRPRDFDRFDLVVAMDAANHRDLHPPRTRRDGAGKVVMLRSTAATRRARPVGPAAGRLRARCSTSSTTACAALVEHVGAP